MNVRSVLGPCIGDTSREISFWDQMWKGSDSIALDLKTVQNL
jgi:hypothetical protein